MADQVVAAVRRFSRFYTRQLGVLDEGLLHSPYTLTEVRVMYEIAHGDEVSAINLTEQLRIDAGYLSRIIRKLERQGLVERQTCTKDRRRSILALTTKGNAIFAKLDVQQDRDVAMLLSGVSRSGQKDLMGAMRLVEQTLSGERDSNAPIRLRAPVHGDLGWVVHRFSRIFWEEYGYDERFEGLVAKIASEFLSHEPDTGQRCWIAERSGEILGAILLMRQGRSAGQLRLLYVEPSARQQGIGLKLLSEAVAYARTIGYRKLILWTQDEEQAARRLYERAGFSITSTRTHTDFTDRPIVAETWELSL